jgi:omega-6 fatty acid desaturase (delta-12 desaturase)
MDMTQNTASGAKAKPAWQQAVQAYQNSDLRRSLWQVVNSIVPFCILWYLAYRSLAVSYWLTLGIAVLAAGFMMRIFIIFHDCGHGSFFKSQRANSIMGFIAGIFTITPYQQWRYHHAIHHATAGDLDRRGIGDIWTVTVVEYLEMSRLKRLVYRTYRNPFMMFLVGPMLNFIISNRFVTKPTGKRERASVYWTNLTLLIVVAGLSWLIGFRAFILVELPIVAVATSLGVWLFYVQHQFESTYWDRHDDWNFVSAAMHGSSYYKLPKVLQWFTGNIGFHHIHHLSPRIPNYYLEKCHKENPIFQEAEEINLWTSLRSFTYRMWDENRRKLVGYGYIKVYQEKQSFDSGQ